MKQLNLVSCQLRKHIHKKVAMEHVRLPHVQERQFAITVPDQVCDVYLDREPLELSGGGGFI